jgi:hypothetical protein
MKQQRVAVTNQSALIDSPRWKAMTASEVAPSNERKSQKRMDLIFMMTRKVPSGCLKVRILMEEALADR